MKKVTVVYSERAGAPGGAGGTVSPVCSKTPPDSPAGGAGGYLRVQRGCRARPAAA